MIDNPPRTKFLATLVAQGRKRFYQMVAVNILSGAFGVFFSIFARPFCSLGVLHGFALLHALSCPLLAWYLLRSYQSLLRAYASLEAVYRRLDVICPRPFGLS